MPNSDTESDFQADIDQDLEKAGILAYFSEYLVSGRPAPPMLIFWRGKTRILAVTCRPWEDERDRNKAIMEMLFMSPAIMSSTMVLALTDPIKLISGIKRSVVMITVTAQGALATVVPYNIDDSDNTIMYDDDAELDPNGGGAYSDIIGHMLPVFARQRRALFSGPEMVQYLAHRHHEIQFYGDESMETISTYNL